MTSISLIISWHEMECSLPGHPIPMPFTCDIPLRNANRGIRAINNKYSFHRYINVIMKHVATQLQPIRILNLILLTWTIWRAPTNASKWRMGFNPYPANVDNMASSY